VLWRAPFHLSRPTYNIVSLLLRVLARTAAVKGIDIELIQESRYRKGPIRGLNISVFYAPVKQIDLEHVSWQGI